MRKACSAKPRPLAPRHEQPPGGMQGSMQPHYIERILDASAHATYNRRNEANSPKYFQVVKTLVNTLRHARVDSPKK
jgi:hypothetical protein